MAVLVVVALFWGNCFSCPQVLLSAAQHKCCHRSKAPKSECNTQGLQNFVKAEKAAPVASMPVIVAAVEAPAQTTISAVEFAPRPILHSPSNNLPLRI
jgi:hypothetical protein